MSGHNVCTATVNAVINNTIQSMLAGKDEEEPHKRLDVCCL